MSERESSIREPHALERFQTEPNALYDLETTAALAGVPRRSVLIYCRLGIVQPVYRPPYGAMAFDEEAIYTVRRAEYARTVQGIDAHVLKTMLALFAELEQLKAELRFHRHH